MNRISQIIEPKSQKCIARHAVHANTFLMRLKGLLGTNSLREGHALWVMPCNSIHTFGMRYAIDVIFLDTDNIIEKLSPTVRPNSICTGYGISGSVIELPANTLDKFGLSVGDQLECHAHNAPYKRTW